jgi:preprotein translocase subunit SecD
MTGKDLNADGTRQDFDTTTNQPIVTMQFTDKGADKFHDVTKDIVDSSRFRSSQGRGKVLDSFAIVLDGRIKSAPTVDSDENPDGIPGDNGAQITGIGDVGEAKDLALVLQTGALPVKFETLDRTDISATLGKDSLAEAWKAAIGGLILVAIFLAVALNPAVEAFERRGLARHWAASLVFGLALLALTGIGFLVLTLGGAIGVVKVPSRKSQVNTASAAT